MKFATLKSSLKKRESEKYKNITIKSLRETLRYPGLSDVIFPFSEPDASITDATCFLRLRMFFRKENVFFISNFTL